MNTRYIVRIILFFLLLSCSTMSPEKESVKKTLEKGLSLEMFQTAYYKGDIVQFKSFFNKFKYKYIVYLLDDCSPCYDKYINWHKEMEEINLPDNFTILFIIRGKYVENFLSEVNSIEYTYDRYFIVMDANFVFPDGNSEIPRWILEESILIDEKNKIRMVGPPFLNSKSLKRFKRIVSQ